MKLLYPLLILICTAVLCHAQQVYVNPGGVTLTKQGLVTLIITDNKVNSASGGTQSTASLGTLTVTYSNAQSNYHNYVSSTAITGTLAAGDYGLTTTGGPLQVTVILWNEQSGGSSGSFAINDVALAYGAASAADQSAFQSFIASLVQTQLASLQSQIDSQQIQLTTLQQWVAQQQSAIDALLESQAATHELMDSIINQLASLQQGDAQQQAAISGLQQSQELLQSQYEIQQGQLATLQNTVANQQTTIDMLQQALATTQEQYSQLSDDLVALNSRLTTATPQTTETIIETAGQSDESLSKAAIGLGAAAVVGSVIHFFTQDNNTQEGINE